MKEENSPPKTVILNPDWTCKIGTEQPRYTFDRENHVHKLDGRPLHGTSTVVGILSKELTYYASGKALEPFGWLNIYKSTDKERRAAALNGQSKIMQMHVDEFKDFLQECYHAHRTHKEKSADKGTDMHACLEAYVKHSIYENKGEPCAESAVCQASAEVLRFHCWAVQHVAEFLWSEAHCYSSRLWIGGICDAGALLKNGKVAILDFKSSKESYYGYFVQMAGYAIAIDEHGLLTPDGAPVNGGLKVAADCLVSLPFGSPGTYKFPVFKTYEFTAEFEGALLNYKAKQWCDAELKKINPPKVKYKSVKRSST